MDLSGLDLVDGSANGRLVARGGVRLASIDLDGRARGLVLVVGFHLEGVLSKLAISLVIFVISAPEQSSPQSRSSNTGSMTLSTSECRRDATKPQAGLIENRWVYRRIKHKTSLSAVFTPRSKRKDFEVACCEITSSRKSTLAMRPGCDNDRGYRRATRRHQQRDRVE